MIKLLFLVLFFFLGTFSLKADEAPGGDEEFTKALDNIKSPFEDGFPKPVAQPVSAEQIRPKDLVPVVKPVVPPEVIKLPALDLQGVIVGDEVHQAIINGKVVALQGTIEGAKLDSVSKEGVGLLYKGKKFFLKID
jgi:hypothetical protein